MKNKITISWVAVILVNIGCLFFSAITGSHYWYYAMFAILATGFISFFGVLSQNLALGKEQAISTKAMRLAVTVLIASSYIALLVYLLFIPENIKLAGISETLITNFTAVVGTVMAFFFGSSAYIEGRAGREDGGP